MAGLAVGRVGAFRLGVEAVLLEVDLVAEHRIAQTRVGPPSRSKDEGRSSARSASTLGNLAVEPVGRESADGSVGRVFYDVVVRSRRLLFRGVFASVIERLTLASPARVYSGWMPLVAQEG